MPHELPGVARSTVANSNRSGPMPGRHVPPAHGDRPTIDDILADKRRRLGTALHQLARELAEARRRNRQLERELNRLRTEKEIAG
jgi:hypothetical protein